MDLEVKIVETLVKPEVYPAGPTGPQGEPGEGIPSGGTTGQTLVKSSDSDYDTEWTDGGSGTVTSVAVSGTDGIEVDSGSPITSSGTIQLGVNKETMLSTLNVEDGAEVNNISDVNATDLTDSGDSTLHYHSSDRDRANHTGTQLASTISDFDTEVSNNTDVAANTAHRTSDGTDHTYIDQDVRTTANPTFDGINTSDNILPTVDNTYYLGNSTYRFKDGYFVDENGNTISVSLLAGLHREYSEAVSMLPYSVGYSVSGGVWTITVTSLSDNNDFAFILDDKLVYKQVGTLSVDATSFAGTDSIPKTVYVYVQNNGSDEPELVASNTPAEEGGPYANIARYKAGSVSTDSVNIYGKIDSELSMNRIADKAYKRLYESGVLYKSGLGITATSSDVTIATGTYRSIFDLITTEQRQVSTNGLFYIASDGTYNTITNFGFGGYYSDGTTITNGKYFNVVLGIVEDGTTRIVGLVQSGSVAQYELLAQAIGDEYNQTVYQPNDSLLKYTFLPVCKLIVKNVSGVYQIQQLPDGKYYMDMRGILAGVSGGSSSITDHNSLSGLQGGTTDEYYHLTSAEHTVVGNTSGTNTGDQDLSDYFNTTTDTMDDVTDGTTYVKTHNDYTDAEKSKLSGIEEGAQVNIVNSVNSQTGDVVLDADDIDDTSTTNKFVTASDITNLSNLSGTNTGDQDLSDYTQKSTLTTKGDIYVATADSAPTRLGVGTDGMVLTADSSEATGVKWSDVSKTITSFEGVYTDKTTYDLYNNGSYLNSGQIVKNRLYTLTKISLTAWEMSANYLTKATGTDIDTGTDDTKYVTAKAINDSTKIAQTDEDTTFKEELIAGSIAGKNLFNQYLGITQDKSYQGDGSTTTTSGVFTSDVYIPVTPNTQYTLSDTTAVTLRICEYNSSKTFIQRDALASTTSLTITTTANTYFLRISANYATIGVLQLELGASRTTYYEYQGIGYTSGSNSNGSWIKYDDGTMICRNILSKAGFLNAAGTYTTVQGINWYRSNGVAWTFPQEFVDTDYSLDIKAYTPNNVGSRLIWERHYTKLTSQAGINLIALSDFTSSGDAYAILENVSVKAIGRWK